MTTTYETHLRDALGALFELMQDRAAFEKDMEEQSRRLGEQLQLVERLTSDLPDDAPDMLRHFLEKRSYTKALELLMDQMSPEERAAWRPAC
ncbi:MAG: hypothetical protein A3F84_12460 [Candidatus Handelsmanbacteria bacterium RIFCSPLOWO2_12_FULL_64_10]|uniref:Uncharacterized protein n=1 Tax=Handelsmanbacteria sp. (strain RIFCSPLOWO2_12_FULL_64_10) TaxID=1817868 RepID=A0A1F6CC71_HANXR|nr:MAG: hypothetical protein A3F84_12460 [Candidatus Handelsmanbacteria bacterium RIFCSPLOWO2_12_FULL_64_10]